jgi:hypothetical protein
MIIENNTNYAYKLKYMDNPSFDKVRDLSKRFFLDLPQSVQGELFETLNRGVDLLDSEPQMSTYLHAFGKMHQAKLQYAFGKLPDDFLSQPEIEIIDYGCGQAIGTMCYADFLRENGYVQNVKTITLIEPSEICLKRAALHASVFFPDAEIKTVNKTFDDLVEEDIVCQEETPTLHILSNVLDMTCFNLDKFSGLIKDCLKGYNQFLCVGPYFGSSDKTKRMEEFCSLLEGEQGYYDTFEQNELVEDKTWTAQILCFSVGELDDFLSTVVTEEDVDNGIVDEYGVVYSRDGKRLLTCTKDLIEYIVKTNTKVVCNVAFKDCTSLQQIVIPDSVNEIGIFAFWGCTSLRQIMISNSVTSIGGAVFACCTSLQQVVIPDSVTSIGWDTFIGCTSLQQVSIPDSVTCIEGGAFNDCMSLRQVTIPNSVTSIGMLAFSGCTSLQQIDIPDSVTCIEGGAFNDCMSLRQLNIPCFVRNIGANPFRGCCNIELTSESAHYSICEGLLIDNSAKQIVSFVGKDIKIEIPNSISSIGVSAFSKCKVLQQVFIPDSVTCIENGAFCGCESLTEIHIPNSVQSIGDYAFGDYAFDFEYSKAFCYIPKESNNEFISMIKKHFRKENIIFE